MIVMDTCYATHNTIFGDMNRDIGVPIIFSCIEAFRYCKTTVFTTIKFPPPVLVVVTMYTSHSVDESVMITLVCKKLIKIIDPTAPVTP